jgi:hypothetical protein
VSAGRREPTVGLSLRPLDEKPVTAERPQDRPSSWSQLVLVIGFAWSYDALRALHGNVRMVAVSNGLAVLGIDRALHTGWVAGFTRWVDGHDAVADVLSGYYVVMHLAVVSITLILLWWDGRFYRWHRDALLVISAIGFAVFWFYPVAPPRLLGAGFDDTVAQVLPFAYQSEAAAANLYAAVPSLHVAWAVWCAIALWSVTRNVAFRTLAVAHPVVTVIVVLGTGNHYVVDVLSGLALTVLGYAVMPLVVCAGRALFPRCVRVERPSASAGVTGGRTRCPPGPA